MFNRSVTSSQLLLTKPLSLPDGEYERLMSCSTLSVDRRGRRQPIALLYDDTRFPMESVRLFGVVSCVTCPPVIFLQKRVISGCMSVVIFMSECMCIEVMCGPDLTEAPTTASRQGSEAKRRAALHMDVHV